VHYERQRRPIMIDITLRNRRFGPEAALQLVEERAPDGSRIEDVISQQELETISTSFAAAAGLDVEAVNGRQSFVPSADHRHDERQLERRGSDAEAGILLGSPRASIRSMAAGSWLSRMCRPEAMGGRLCTLFDTSQIMVSGERRGSARRLE
jgi:hypothetical protein